MRYVVEIEQAITVPLVVDARNDGEVCKLAKRLLLHTIGTDPEAVGDPVAKPRQIRSASKPED
ncbi:hypothetical protein [Microbulbifer sp. YPW16]|uniref:hypothetical protein n=1 Tax=Microbulbifer sp. YPW16 TaxID=2904242 RepID=UPI001E6207C6|nr:hypothetical protein [Microbulbifer sp. YPW16]UHQ56640.1 hypothetical protein LVE68_06640 [Microbulbifer sp. YPW16]